MNQLGEHVYPGKNLVYSKYGFVVEGGHPTFIHLSSHHKLEVK